MSAPALATRPWLARLALPLPAAARDQPAPSRRRPLVYVYDMPPEFTTRMLQAGGPWVLRGGVGLVGAGRGGGPLGAWV